MRLARRCGDTRRAELAQILDGVHAEIADPLDQPVQHVHGGLGVGQRAMVRGGGGMEVPGQGRQPAVGHLVAQQDLPGQGRCVDHRPAGIRIPQASQARRRKPMSNGALWATITVPWAKARNDGSTWRSAGCVGHHLVGDAGQHRNQWRDVRPSD